MKQTRWLRVRTFPVVVTLLAALVASSGSTCTNGNNEPSSGAPGTPFPENPAGAQPGSDQAPNHAPVVTFQWPTAPVTIQAGTVVTIQWTVEDPEDNAVVSIVARDASGSDLVLVQSDMGTSPLSVGHFMWNTINAPVGVYSIVAIAKDGKAAPQTAIAPGQITVTPRSPGPPNPPGTTQPVPNTPPTITFNTPSSNVTVNQGDPYSIVVTTQDLEDAVQLMVWVDPDG